MSPEIPAPLVTIAYRDSYQSAEERTADLLARITLEETAAQIAAPFGAFVDAHHPPITGRGDAPAGFLNGIRAHAGEESTILSAPGCSVATDEGSRFAETTSIAGRANVAVVVFGDQAGVNGIGTVGEGLLDSSTRALPVGVQRELAEAAATTGAPTIVMLSHGRAFVLDCVGGALFPISPGLSCTDFLRPDLGVVRETRGDGDGDPTLVDHRQQRRACRGGRRPGLCRGPHRTNRSSRSHAPRLAVHRPGPGASTRLCLRIRTSMLALRDRGDGWIRRAGGGGFLRRRLIPNHSAEREGPSRRSRPPCRARSRSPQLGTLTP